jgi:hypothetical protein
MKRILVMLLLAVVALASCKRESTEQAIERRVKDMGGAAAQLGTVEYTISKIIDGNHGGAFYKIGERKILFSTRSTMKAGVNLKNFCADSILIDPKLNTITINLPKPQIVSFNMPAESIKQEFSLTTGFRSEFSVEDRMELLKQGEADILADAEEFGIFADAEKNVRTLFEAMLSTQGYSKIIINFN